MDEKTNKQLSYRILLLLNPISFGFIIATFLFLLYSMEIKLFLLTFAS